MAWFSSAAPAAPVLPQTPLLGPYPGYYQPQPVLPAPPAAAATAEPAAESSRKMEPLPVPDGVDMKSLPRKERKKLKKKLKRKAVRQALAKEAELPEHIQLALEEQERVQREQEEAWQREQERLWLFREEQARREREEQAQREAMLKAEKERKEAEAKRRRWEEAEARRKAAQEEAQRRQMFLLNRDSINPDELTPGDKEYLKTFGTEKVFFFFLAFIPGCRILSFFFVGLYCLLTVRRINTIVPSI